jgi:hypothetical protein
MAYDNTTNYRLIFQLAARSIGQHVLSNLDRKEGITQFRDAMHEVHEELNALFERSRYDHAKAYLITELIRMLNCIREEN